MRALIAVLAAAALLVPSAPVFALGSEKAMYVGGTTGGVPDKAEGFAVVTDPDAYEFVAEKGGAKIRIPWKRIQTIEYGQRASRRIRTAILLSPLALFHKARKHMISIAYKDKSGAEQAVVLELGKNVYRTNLAALKAKSGKPVACQDEEAAKQMGGGCTILPPDPEDDKKK